MLQNFSLSVQAVLPLFFMLMLGFLIRKKAWLSPEEISRFNGVIFKTLFPFLVFSNIYQTDLTQSLSPALLVFSLGGTFLIFLFATVLMPRIEKNPASCGAMIQTTYCSNFVLLGLPLVSNLFHGLAWGMTAVAVALFFPFFMLLSAIALER